MPRYIHAGFYVLLTSALMLISITASANSGREQFLVSVMVIRNCRVAMQNLAIDSAPAGQRAAMIKGAVAFSCSRNTGYAVSFSSGANPAGTRPVTVAGVGNGATQVMPVYSRIPIPPGSHTGTLVMTINY
ncbi:MAG: spore coat protein U domain-containing protein [Gammaproteobacteria bacterium]